MSSYKEFVKETFHKLPANMSAKDKMKKMGEMWRAKKSGKVETKQAKGKGVAGGALSKTMAVHKMTMKAKPMKSLLGGNKGMRKMPAGGSLSKAKKGKVSKAMKSAGGAIPWDWQYLDPNRPINDQLQEYYTKGLVPMSNPLGPATLAQVEKYGGDEQTLEYNHRYWLAKDEGNRLYNAVAVDNQKRADEPSFGEKLATTAVSSLASALPEIVAAGFKKQGRPSKKVSGGQIVGGSAVAGSHVTVVPDVPLVVKEKVMINKEKMKLKKAMHKLEMASHQKKLTKKQEAKLKEMHKLHAGGLFDD
jgi:hypothetical protein